MSKANLAVLISILLVVGLALGIMSVEASPTEQTKLIKVNGTASIKALPDTSYITAGVKVENESIEVAQKEAAEKMDKIMKAIKSTGVKEENIKTTYFNISNKYIWDEKTSTNEVIGYTVTNQVEVKSKHVDKLGTLIDKIVEAGGNVVSGIRFTVEDETDLYNKALAEAVKNAETKALTLGKAYNVKVVKPVIIEELSSNINYPIMNRATLSEDSRTSISPGQMEVTADVRVEFTY